MGGIAAGLSGGDCSAHLGDAVEAAAEALTGEDTYLGDVEPTPLAGRRHDSQPLYQAMRGARIEPGI